MIPARYVKKENPKKSPKDPPTEPIKLPVVIIKTSSLISLVALLKYTQKKNSLPLAFDFELGEVLVLY